ncbi:MAG: hypothetical protein H0T73_02390 [Ardenticatenales bacterium]|nr:hypothetical protein [Ardenticatenales bacterium]
MLAFEHGFTAVEADDKTGARQYLLGDSYDLMVIQLVGVWYAPNDDFCTIDDVLEFRREKELTLSNTRMLLILPQHLQLTESEKERLMENHCSYLQTPVDIDIFQSLVLALLA